MSERVKLDEFNAVPSGEIDELVTGDGPVFTDLRDREARDIEWLDKPILAAGELVSVNADGGTGKGLLAVHYAARISRGELGRRRMVVFAVAEDAFETVLKPRLLAAEADLEFVRCVNWRRDGYTDAIRIPDDIPELEERIAAIEAGLLVIDPLLSHLSAKTNSHTDHEVRVALRPLIVLAQNTGCAVLGNGNFSKNKKDGARAAASGSTAFTNVPRIGLAMASDDEDPDVRILEVVKSNIGAARIGRNYRIRAVRIEGLAEDVPVIVLEGASTKNVDDLLLANQDRRRRVPAELVREVILRELESGDKSRMYLDTACKDELGVNPDTVYKSGLAPLRETGRIQAHKEGMNDGWYWSSKMDVERP